MSAGSFPQDLLWLTYPYCQRPVRFQIQKFEIYLGSSKKLLAIEKARDLAFLKFSYDSSIVD